MKPASFAKVLLIIAPLFLAACGNDTPAGPDLSGLSSDDSVVYKKAFDICSINNTRFDCNCVAKVRLAHHKADYERYKADYDTVHKPELEQKIATLSATIAEKTKNASDERIIESLEEDLDHLKTQLANGANSIVDFEPSVLPPDFREQCVIN